MSRRPHFAAGAPGLLLPGALLALLVVAVYADPLFFRRLYTGRDPIGYHFPVEHAVHDAYARGRLPVWIPGISGGRPLLANPNVGTLYPLRPLLSLIPFETSLRVFPVLHWILGGLGMLAALRVLGVSRAGGWVGAVTYVFSGASVSHVFYPNIHPGLALLPWLVWAVARPVLAPAARVLPAALLFALLFLAGDLFSIALAFLACVLWTLLEVARGRRAAEGALLGAAILLGALAAMPQILAAALWVPETNRAVLGLKLRDALLFSLSPWRLLELAVPYPFGTTWEVDYTRIWGWPVFRHKAVGFFSSLYCGALAVIALYVTRRSPGTGRRFSRAFLLATLAVSVLPSLLPAAWGDLPALLPLRYPEKFATGITLALAFLSGMAIDALRGAGRAPRWALAAGGALALLALGAHLAPEEAGRLAVSLTGAERRHAAVAAQRLPGAFAEAGVLWILTVVALDLLGRGGKRAAALSLLLLTVVPIAGNRRIAQTSREENVLAPTAFARWVRRADPEGAFRVVGESTFRGPSALEARQLSSDFGQVEVSRRNWNQYTHVLWGASTVLNEDFDVGDFSRIESLRRMAVFAAGYRDAQHFFGGLSQRWGIRFRDTEALPGYRRFGGDALQDWDEHAGAYPDIRLVAAWREAESAVAALNVLPRLAPGEIVLETGSRGVGRARPGQLRVLERSPERLRFETVTPDPGWLFVLRSFWNHRDVRMDGAEVEDVPAQLAFSALTVPAGRHHFEWREKAPGWEVARAGPLLAAGIAAALLVAGRRRPS